MGTQTAGTGTVDSLGDKDVESVVGDSAVSFVAFYTDWCGTCQRMEPPLESIAVDTDAAVLTGNIESHFDTAIEFGAQRTPMVVLFGDGRPVKQLRGGQNEQSLRELITRDSYVPARNDR